MLVGLIGALALASTSAPPVDLDIAPGFSGVPCVPTRIIRVGADGSLAPKGQSIQKSRVVPALGPVSGGQCERVNMTVDDGAPYGAVFDLISILRAAGFRQIALVDRPWEDAAP
ncbi:MAG TPA: hypothetical protein PLO65_04930 [Caulobacter sp.]|nr:hypothetical protein [Caulobacter sp.]